MQDKILIHHGIEGQKWGRRNGPPYPLSYDAHSVSEKKKMKIDAKNRDAILKKLLKKVLIILIVIKRCRKYTHINPKNKFKMEKCKWQIKNLVPG